MFSYMTEASCKWNNCNYKKNSSRMIPLTACYKQIENL